MQEQLTMFGAPARLDRLTVSVERNPALGNDAWSAVFHGTSRKAHQHDWVLEHRYVSVDQVLLLSHHVREALAASVLTGGYRVPVLSPLDSLQRLYWE